jgi:outer membrane protein assembly factor BamE (lipoprotein component of BamABCDE complex)
MATGTRPHGCPQNRNGVPARCGRAPARALALLLAAAALGGCVTQDATTGENIPRGNQRYEFAKVEKYAEQLKDGMTKAQVLMLLGSAAEMDDAGDTWIYLPERYGILIPARALQLEFKDSVLVSHGYRPIILGAKF